MCLRISPRDKIKTAKKDIICYKNVRKRGIDSVESPYREFRYELNKLYETELSRDSDGVNQGFHSYETIYGAREDVIYQQEREKSNELPIMNEYQIVQCVIPKGAEYYEGTFAEWESYASNQIKIIGEIDL